MRWLLLAIVAAVAVWIIQSGIRRRGRNAAQDAAFRAAHEGWDIFISPVDRGVIALEPETGELILGRMDTWKAYALDDISAVEVLRDGLAVAAADRGHAPPEASEAGAAEPDVVAPVGRRRARRSFIRSVEMEVIVDDAGSPAHLIEFFRSPSGRGTDVRNARLRAAVEASDRFQSILFGALSNRRSLDALPLAASMEFARLRELSEGSGSTLEEFLLRWASRPPGGAAAPAAEGT
jgi:hypothetical protein